MSFLNRAFVERNVGIAAILAMALAVAGCAPRGLAHLEDLPGEEHLVGGGLMINWQAPEDGIVYLVERRTGKLIETRSLLEGETYSFAVETAVDAADMESLLGIDIAHAEFLLYFEPTGSRNDTP